MVTKMMDLLVADDRKRFRKDAANFFRRRGYNVSEAEDGNQALRLGTSCDIAILDIDMPGQSGLDVSEKIRDEAPNVFRIVISGIDECKAQATEKVYLYDLFLEKPFHLQEMLDDIDIEEVILRMPLKRVLQKIRSALVEISDEVQNKFVEKKDVDSILGSATQFAKDYFWNVKFSSEYRRGSVLLLTALRTLSFIPSSTSKEHSLIVPDIYILNNIIALSDATDACNEKDIDRAIVNLDKAGINLLPDFGDQIDEYEKLYRDEI